MRAIGSFALVATIFVAAGCGYMTRGLYPSHIHTVSVPILQSKGLRRDIEFQVTERLIQAIEAQTPIKVVQSGEADSELTGTIQSFFKTPYGEDGFDNPRGGIMNIILAVQWVDNTTGKVIRESQQNFVLNTQEEYLINLGQSQATATDSLAKEIADHIVTMMQAPW